MRAAQVLGTLAIYKLLDLEREKAVHIIFSTSRHMSLHRVACKLPKKKRLLLWQKHCDNCCDLRSRSHRPTPMVTAPNHGPSFRVYIPACLQ